MGILYVNGKRRGLRVRGRARVKVNAGRRARKGKMPPALARYWRAKRAAGAPRRRRAAGRRVLARARARARTNPAKRGRKRAGLRWRKGKNGQWAVVKTSSRRRARHGSSSMAKRKKGGKRRARRSKSSRRRAALKGIRRRKGRKARKRTGGKRRRGRKRRTGGGKRRRARRKRTGGKRRRGRKRRTGGGKRRRGRKRSRSRSQRTRRMGSATRRFIRTPHSAVTLMMNPGRKRRRKRRSGGRRRHRRVHRRYGRRHYRKNPGGMLIDLAKRALPVLIGLYGTRFIVNRLGPMIPGVSMLGAFQGPALAIGGVIGVNFATKKVGALAKHRTELVLGAALNALDSLFQSFAPASVKAMLGMSDYIALGDYIGIGATPLDDNMTMSDYIAVGDSVQEELGLEEELGVEEELGNSGNDLLGGVSEGGVRSGALVKTVPGQSFLQPVPARSFTRQIPTAGARFDSPNKLYGGIFGGGFGH